MKRQELKLFSELYESSIPQEKDDLETLKKNAKIFDINPNLNFKIMLKMLDEKDLVYKDSEKIYYFFRNYIQTLFFNQKKAIIDLSEKDEKYKTILELKTSKFFLNEKSFIDCFFEIIKKLYDASINPGLSLDKKIDYNQVENLFLKDYFVDNYEIKIPLIYGTNELIFSGFINDLYLNLFYISDKEKLNTSKEKDEITNKNIEQDSKFEKPKIISRIKFITPFSYRILSDDFREIFDLKILKKKTALIYMNANQKKI